MPNGRLAGFSNFRVGWPSYFPTVHSSQSFVVDATGYRLSPFPSESLTDGRANPPGFLRDVPISEWYGVTTDGNGRVTELDLDGNQLSGEIPPELGNLANLTRLYLDGNQLTGCVPSSLSGRLNMDNSDLGDIQFCP